MKLVDEVLFHPAWKELDQGPATSWLVFISLFREEIPWIYEVGLELYHALRCLDQKAIIEARINLIRVLDISSGPLIREIVEDGQIIFLIRELPSILDFFLLRLGHIPDPRPAMRVPQRLKKTDEKEKNEG